MNKKVLHKDGERKYYGEIAVSSLLTSIGNNGGYTKQIHRRPMNKTVPVFIVFYYVFKKSRYQLQISTFNNNIINSNRRNQYLIFNTCGLCIHYLLQIPSILNTRFCVYYPL